MLTNPARKMRAVNEYTDLLKEVGWYDKKDASFLRQSEWQWNQTSRHFYETWVDDLIKEGSKQELNQ